MTFFRASDLTHDMASTRHGAWAPNRAVLTIAFHSVGWQWQLGSKQDWLAHAVEADHLPSCSFDRGHYASADELAKSEPWWDDGEVRSVLNAVEAAYRGSSSDASIKHFQAGRGAAEISTAALLGEPDSSVFTYGELDPSSLIDMLRCLDARRGQRFYDIGSGIGKIVVAASLLGLNATGIEAVRERCALAQVAAKRVAHATPMSGDNLVSKPLVTSTESEWFPEYASVTRGGVPRHPPRLLHASFFDVDFSDADIMFMNSMLFTEEMMEQLSGMALKLRPGALIVSSKTLLGDGFERVGAVSTRASWSDSPFLMFIQRRVQGPGQESAGLVCSAAPGVGESTACNHDG